MSCIDSRSRRQGVPMTIRFSSLFYLIFTAYFRFIRFILIFTFFCFSLSLSFLSLLFSFGSAVAQFDLFRLLLSPVHSFVHMCALLYSKFVPPSLLILLCCEYEKKDEYLRNEINRTVTDVATSCWDDLAGRALLSTFPPIKCYSCFPLYFTVSPEHPSQWNFILGESYQT